MFSDAGPATRVDVPFATSISAYHTEQWKHVIKALKKVVKCKEEETIHHARVEIKKLAALCNFMEYCHKSFNSRNTLKPVTKIYKLMGKLRNHTNALSLCFEFKIDTGIFDKEAKSMKAVSRKTKAQIEKYLDKIRRIKKLTAKQLHHTDIHKWETYLLEKEKEVNNIFLLKPANDDIHTARKCIKQLMYNRAIAENTAPHSANNNRYAVLIQLQNKISRWHDLSVFKHKLLLLLYNNTNPKTYARIRKQEQQCRAQISTQANKQKPLKA